MVHGCKTDLGDFTRVEQVTQVGAKNLGHVVWFVNLVIVAEPSSMDGVQVAHCDRREGQHSGVSDSDADWYRKLRVVLQHIDQISYGKTDEQNEDEGPDGFSGAARPEDVRQSRNPRIGGQFG